MTAIKMPTYADLTAQMGATFDLLSADGLGTSAVMIDAYEGIAMNSRYQSYAAQFALPHGIQLPQAVYAVHNGKEEWPLLLTPVMPGEDGRARMEAVFHVAAHTPSKTVAAGAKPAVSEESGPAGSLVA